MKWITNLFDLLKQILLRLHNIDKSTSRPFDVTVSLDSRYLPNPLDNDRSLDSAFRWTLQNGVNDFYLWFNDHYSASLKEIAEHFIAIFNDGSEVINFTDPDGSPSVSFIRPKGGLGFFVLRDWLNLFDPSNFLFPRTIINSYQYDTQDQRHALVFSNGNGGCRGFSMSDIMSIVGYIECWGRPYSTESSGALNSNMLAPQCYLASRYKNFQANEHNFQYARMHSRDYLKQYLNKTLSDWMNHRNDSNYFKTNSEIHNWFLRVLFFPFQRGLLDATELSSYSSFLASSFTYSNVESFVSRKIYDCAAVNLDETPQKAYFDIFASYFYFKFKNVDMHFV